MFYSAQNESTLLQSILFSRPFIYHFFSHLWHHVAASQQICFPKASVIISAG